MKDRLNATTNPRILKLDDIEFFYSEDNDCNPSPVDKYYLSAHELSITLKIKLKWVLFGYYFLSSISTTIGDEHIYTSRRLLVDSINSDLVYPTAPHVLTLDSYTINNDIGLLTEILDSEYTESYYDENTLVRLKLKINIVEYIMINNMLYPQLGYFGEPVTL